MARETGPVCVGAANDCVSLERGEGHTQTLHAPKLCEHLNSNSNLELASATSQQLSSKVASKRDAWGKEAREEAWEEALQCRASRA